MEKTKKCFVVHVKSSEIELVVAFLDRSDAVNVADKWGKYSAIYELDVRDNLP